MSEHDQVQLVVIDDSVRFAFHVWRYLGRSIGIGGADDQLMGNFEERGKPRPMETADGRAAIWWVQGDGNLPENLHKVLKGLRPGPHFFLIDMRGKDDLAVDNKGLGEKALNLLFESYDKVLNDRQVIMVSSYETGILSFRTRQLRIWPKSPDTLAYLKRTARLSTNPRFSRKPKVEEGSEALLHILVTGAGFEIRSDSTGGFGLPVTKELLSEMGLPFGKGELRFIRKRMQPARATGDTKPSGTKQPLTPLLPYLHLKTKQEIKEFRKLCTDPTRGGLDAWWDFLLDRVLRNNVPSDPKERGKMKMLASVKERGLREAFRRIILKYDWGHLNHALEAAKEPWHAWLTTNYTRFADRAIALRETRDGKSDKLDWRIVSTSIEALSLSRESLHGDRGSPNSPKNRYLFKLHGDVAHLQTMATAGQDKDFFSSLSLPVDSLHQVYSAAETLLEHLIGDAKDKRLVWHIVGHDLQDSLLLDLIARVSAAHVNAESTDFIVVKRTPFSSRTCEKLKDFLNEKVTDLGVRVEGYPATSEEYLARIARTGGLPETFKDDSAKKWLEKLGETRSSLSEKAKGAKLNASVTP